MAKATDAATKEIAKGLASILTIPANELGNLVPFAEGASLEDEDDEDIQTLWANLLKSSGDLDIGDSLMFVSFLKRIGRREVELLKELIESGRATTRAMFISNYNAEDSEWLDRDQFETLIERLPEDFDFALLADLVVDVGECTGVMFDEVVLLAEDEDGDPVEVSSNLNWETRNRRAKPATALESLGVLERIDFRNIDVPQLGSDAQLFVRGYRATPAGIAFYEACSGVPFKHRFDRDVDDDQTAGFRKWCESKLSQG